MTDINRMVWLFLEQSCESGTCGLSPPKEEEVKPEPIKKEVVEKEPVKASETVVQSGDTVGALARKAGYEGSLWDGKLKQKFQDANPDVKDWNQITPGQKLNFGFIKGSPSTDMKDKGAPYIPDLGKETKPVVTPEPMAPQVNSPSPEYPDWYHKYTKQGYKISNDIVRSIENAAKEHGTDSQILAGIAAKESRFNPTVKNPNSTATGLYQFLSDKSPAILKGIRRGEVPEIPEDLRNFDPNDHIASSKAVAIMLKPENYNKYKKHWNL